MPVIIPFIPAIIAAAATAVGASAIVATALMIAASLIVGAITKSSRSANGFSAEAQGRTQVVRSNVQPRNMIYGRAMTSGPLVFAASTDGPSKKNQYMHLVIALADHECDDVEEVYLGEDAVGPLDSTGFALDGKFVKKWGENKTWSSTVPNGVTQITLNTGNPFRRVIAILQSTDTGDFSITDYAWAEGSAEITLRGLQPTGGTLSINYEALRALSLVCVRKHLGSPDQQAEGQLMLDFPALWTADHRLQGVCYLYIRLEFDSDIFPNGLPNVKALVRGKKLYDPRTGVTAWSNNWALCVYDYLRDANGFGCASADMDLQTIVTSANVSDEWLDIGGGMGQSRYRCDGVVMSDKSPRDNLSEMITASGGVVTITGGVFRVFAGAYDIPTVTLTESDLRGSVKVRPRTSRKDLFNNVKGTFINPKNNWQPSDFPPVGNALYAAQDGEVIDRDVELPFTTDAILAQRLAKITLERSRQGIVVEYPAKLTAFQVTAYSTVYLKLAKFGWAGKVFRVMSWKLSNDGGIDLVLNEEAATVYDWSMGDATTVDPAPDTNLPNPFVVEPVGALVLDSGESQLILSQSGVVLSRILVAWPPVSEVSLGQMGQIELQYKLVSDASWIPLPTMPASSSSAYISPVEDGASYLVRARYVSALGVHSPDWTYSPVHVVIGKLSPPSNMTGLSLTALNGMANLTWDSAPDLDVRNGGQARIRHTTNLVQPSWDSALDIGGLIAGAANSAQLPLLTGVYLGKWIDSTGHESLAATMVVTTAPALDSLNVVATVDEQPTFAGTKSNIVFDPALNGIKLIGAGLIDDQGLIDASGLWDDQGLIDGLGAIDTVVGVGGWGLIDSLGGVVGSGTYTFAGSLDLGSVEKSRLTATIDAVSFDTGDMVDARFDLIDSWQSIDGDLINDTAVTLYVRTTNDNPSGSPVWSVWQRFSVGDYEARAFQWKVLLESGSATHNVVVTKLSVDIDMPDRRESGRDVISGAGPKAITFNKPFRVLPVLGITAQDMAQGDYFVITPKAETGFTITFKNAASAAVSRKFDWDAVAY